MKKLAIALLVAGGLYYYFNKKKTDDTTPEEEQAQTGPTGDVFRDYNNQVIKDIKGYWMLVLDGKLYTPKSTDTLIAWQNANPTKPGVVEVGYSVWEENNDKAAGSF